MARLARQQRGEMVQFSGFARKLNHPLLFLRAKRAKKRYLIKVYGIIYFVVQAVKMA
jgi:hypothetical protein